MAQASESANNILSKIKTQSTVKAADSGVKINPNTGEISGGEPSGKVVADVRATKLNSLLNKLGQK
jgi:hypothetical protein